MASVRSYLAEAAAACGPGETIALDDDVVDRLVPGATEPRWACGVLFQVAAHDPDAITRGEYRLALNGIFHGAGLSLARFAHLLGERADVSNPVDLPREA